MPNKVVGPRKAIDDTISKILRTETGSTKGHEVITDYVVALLRGKGEEWVEKYEWHGPTHWRCY